MHPWNSEPWQQLAARRESLPQALLIHGPKGIGKLELARRFAQLVLCETEGLKEPCGRCDGCRWFLAGQHPDFRQIEPEAVAGPQDLGEDAPAPSKTTKPSHEIKVDQVRELAGFLNIGSHRGKRRIALFHPAEDMNANAANSLLKSLEDPASGACFILVSDNPRRLIPTIRSRCIAVGLGIPDQASSLAWLKAEQVEDAANWLDFAGGAPLLAREYALSERGSRIKQVVGLLKQGDRNALLAWPVADREQMEVLSEVLQKWAFDQAVRGLAGNAKRYFFGLPGSKPVSDAHSAAWLRFACEAGRYRVAARHPLNPRLFAADLINRMPQ